jgi:hypothetical protein
VLLHLLDSSHLIISTPHEETGFSPFELLYGWPVRGPTEILKLAMTGEEDVEKSVIEHVINVRERLSEMRDIVGKNLSTCSYIYLIVHI